MKWFVLLMVAAWAGGCGDQPAGDDVVVITTDPDPATTEEMDEQTDQTAELDGEALYAANCQTCHGPEGRGGSTWKGSIQGFEGAERIMLDGRSTMAALPLSEQDAGLIQDYLMSFGVDRTAWSGEEMYQARCSTCHGDTGQGSERSFPIRFMHPDFGSWVVRNGRSTTQFDGPMPVYGEDEISDRQLDEIVDYLHSFTKPQTRPGLYEAFCANCHGDDGRSGYVGRWIAGEGESVSMIRFGHGGSQYGARRSYMPSWGPELLTDADARDIDTYVRGL